MEIYKPATYFAWSAEFQNSTQRGILGLVLEFKIARDGKERKISRWRTQGGQRRGAGKDLVGSWTRVLPCDWSQGRKQEKGLDGLMGHIAQESGPTGKISQ